MNSKIQKRDAKGHFLPNGGKGKRHFNQRYIKKEALEDLLYDAYTSGFENGAKLKATVSAGASFRSWRENNK